MNPASGEGFYNIFKRIIPTTQYKVDVPPSRLVLIEKEFFKEGFCREVCIFSCSKNIYLWTLCCSAVDLTFAKVLMVELIKWPKRLHSIYLYISFEYRHQNRHIRLIRSSTNVNQNYTIFETQCLSANYTMSSLTLFRTNCTVKSDVWDTYKISCFEIIWKMVVTSFFLNFILNFIVNSFVYLLIVCF